jgi:colanic acid biosynthesis glycosyl transferase WcaI
MRVLIACQYFTPEITAGAMRMHAFAAGLAERGHEVEVISEVPSHPAGVVAPGYGGRLVDRREVDGFEVSYVWVRTTPSKRARARLVNYASYAASAATAGLFRKRADVILASSPPLSVGSVGSVLAHRHRAPWVLDVRDLWPDAAVALGEVSEGRLLRASQRLERRLYRRAAAITTTTEPFRRAISERGGDDKVTVIPNGTTAEFLAIGTEEPDRSLLDGDEDVFTWTHAGNIGLFHGLETAVAAAGELGEGFRLILLGQGSRRGQMEELARGLPPGAVTFLDPVPPERAARLMRASDALLVSLGSFPGLEGMVLSKLYDSCAVGRPVVVAAPGETRRVAEEAGAALCVSPGDPSALAGAVRGLRDDRSMREGFIQRARAFAEASSREAGVERLEGVLSRVTARVASARDGSH